VHYFTSASAIDVLRVLKVLKVLKVLEVPQSVKCARSVTT
jgi:hypothetical protein